MRQAIRIVLAALIGAQAFATAAFAQSAPSDSARKRIGRILGILDATTSVPIDSVEVTDLIGDAVFRTGKSGLIGLAGFRRQHDSIAVRVRKIGYQDTAFVVLTSEPDSIPITLLLERVSTLDAVVSTAKVHERVIGPLADFAERLNDKSLHGTFFTPADMRKNDGRRIDDMLKPIVDAKAHGCRGGASYIVDGLPVNRFEELGQSVDDYDAVEIYDSGSLPIRFVRMRPRGGCTVVLLWSRAR